MADVSRIAVITPLERDKDVRCPDGIVRRRMFEAEAIRMVESFRKRGGWMKDVQIHAFDVNGASVRDSTSRRLRELGCEIHVCSDGGYREIGFMTEPICGRIAEETLDVDYLVKLDLDLVLLRPPEHGLFDLGEFDAMVEQPSVFDLNDKRMTDVNPFDTCLIVSKADSGFYSKYCDACESPSVVGSDEYRKLYGRFGDYWIEEFAMDYMYKNGIGRIRPAWDHVFGEGYDPIDMRSDEQIGKILFMHCHISPDGDASVERDFMTDYAKRVVRIRRWGGVPGDTLQHNVRKAEARRGRSGTGDRQARHRHYVQQLLQGEPVQRGPVQQQA